MGYKIIARSSWQRRGEQWDNKSYATREQAKEEIEKARKKYAKYPVFKGDTFKIVKEKMDKTRNQFKTPTMAELMRM